MNIVDLGAARFKAAASADKTTARDALLEAIRQIDDGEWPMHSVCIVGIADDEDGDADAVGTIHGGPASSGERLGMFVRAQRLLMRDMYGED